MTSTDLKFTFFQKYFQICNRVANLNSVQSSQSVKVKHK